MLACPRCSVPLGSCGCSWAELHGVPDLYLAAADRGEDPAITDRVRGFYEEHPFPSYRPEDDLGSLMRAGRANPFLRALDEEIPPGARVVEVGCGTGQLSIFLAAGGRQVVGLDLSLASLAVAEAFRVRAGVADLRFARANLFRPPIEAGSVDVLLAQGVLHHTGAPRAALGVLAGLLRPGGYLVVGLYNRWGRLLLPLLRRKHAASATDARGEAWFFDQHRHPHESRHSADEVLGWLAALGLQFVSSLPPLELGAPPGPLFVPQDPGSWAGRQLAQLSWLGRAADGGLWITVARRPTLGAPLG